MKTLSTDARYWATILVACTMGETAGDFVSHGLNLGYLRASLALIVLFGAVMALELRAKEPNEARYWAAIVITSTTGTTLADFVTRTLKLGYGWGTAALLAVLAIVLLVWPKRATEPATDDAKHVPATNARYWTAILVIATIGTTLGDFVSDGLEVGTARGSLLLGALLAIAVALELRAKARNQARYYAAIVLTSTIGATAGDYLTKDDGLNLGFALGSAILAVLFVAVVLLGRRKAQPAVT